MTKLVVLTFSIPIVGGMCSFADAQEKLVRPRKQVPRTAISADDINRKFVVIGPLGIPLGDVATVDGTVHVNEGKGPSNQFQITAVNGKALNKPVIMQYQIWPWSGLKTLETDTPYRLRVYQNGGFSGVPEQAMKETTVVQTHAYHFVTSLVVVCNASPATPKR